MNRWLGIGLGVAAAAFALWKWGAAAALPYLALLACPLMCLLPALFLRGGEGAAARRGQDAAKADGDRGA